MIMYPEDWKVRELIDFFAKGILFPNPKKSAFRHGKRKAWFQRAVVWKARQMQMLVDSVLRGYYMPLIYLRELPGKEGYEIIDGQQRIRALHGFKTGNAVICTKRKTRAKNSGGSVELRVPVPPLIDPQKDESFPDALRGECEWADETFKNLSPTLQNKFLDHAVSVVIIKGGDEETADMFIRLQGGSALTSQEKRDSWPGDFCGHVLKIGGKEWEDDDEDLPGHKFFRHPDFMNQPSPDRGQIRQLVAQILMLFLLREEKGPLAFSSIGAGELDSCYRRRIKMETAAVESFVEILDRLYSIFECAPPEPKFDKDHDVIPLILFADMLQDDFHPQWERGIVRAIKQWREQVRRAKKMKRDGLAESIPPELVPAMGFINLAKPSAENIRRRQAIYAREMIALLGDDLKPANEGASPGDSVYLREAVYYRDNRECHRCNNQVEFADAHFQQVPGHAAGKFMEPWALVHQRCAY